MLTHFHTGVSSAVPPDSGLKREFFPFAIPSLSVFLQRDLVWLNSEMDYSESTKIVFQRIQKHDPENVSKIMGYLLFKDRGELEMIRLAFGPDYIIQTLIEKTKLELELCSKPAGSGRASTSQATRAVSTLPTKFTPFVPPSSCPTAPLPANNGQCIPQIHDAQLLMPNVPYFPVAYVNPAAPGCVFPYQPQFMPLEDLFGSLNLAGLNGDVQSYSAELAKHQMPDQRAPSIPELNMQICENFRRGYCKYGSNCKYLHVMKTENGYLMVLNPSRMDQKVHSNHALRHGSFKQLEMDFVDLLKSRRGIPVTIYSLSILYFDKYGKVLELEPYLAEARKQGMLSGGLPEFLSQMSKSFLVIDRPLGMQSIILKDDIPRYMKFVEEKSQHDLTTTSSHQVYLTFPPQSMFGDLDLHIYFSHFGPVQDIRIPFQEKRMYGFVTYFYPESAALVLSKFNPHFICGAQVLVKPYRYKQPSFNERKTEEKVQQPTKGNPVLQDAESHPPLTSQPCMNMMFPKEHIEENEQEVDYKMKHVFNMDTVTSSSCNCSSAGQTSAVLSSCSTSESKFNAIPYNDTDLQSSDGLNLPDSPFSF